jgi:tetratricopeptide (TPR) repeat protein
LAEQSLAHFREQGDTPFSVYPLGLLGLIHLAQGELEAARPLLEESLAIGKRTGVETDAVHLALGLARLLTLQGDAVSARHLYQESLTLLFECNVYKEDIAGSLEGLAALEVGQGEPLQAARLWGAAEALREAIGAPMHPVYRPSYGHARAHACAQAGEQAFHLAWAEGRGMTPEQAFATEEPVTKQVSSIPPSSQLGQLAQASQEMARQVYARKQHLQQQVQQLRIEIDQTSKTREVAAITESVYFQQLLSKAKKFRNRGRKDE